MSESDGDVPVSEREVKRLLREELADMGKLEFSYRSGFIPDDSSVTIHRDGGATVTLQFDEYTIRGVREMVEDDLRFGRLDDT